MEERYRGTRERDLCFIRFGKHAASFECIQTLDRTPRNEVTLKFVGKRKISTKVKGHQNCGDCHPEQKSHKARARLEEKIEIESQLESILPTKIMGKNGVPSITLHLQLLKIQVVDEFDITLEFDGTPPFRNAGVKTRPPGLKIQTAKGYAREWLTSLGISLECVEFLYTSQYLKDNTHAQANC